MHLETGLLVLLFVILALIVGALVRHLLKGSQIPWAKTLPPNTQEKLVAMIEHDLFEPGQSIKQQGPALNKLGIISRGSYQAESVVEIM